MNWTPQLRYRYERLLIDQRMMPTAFVTEDPDLRDSIPLWSRERQVEFLLPLTQEERVSLVLLMGFEVWLAAETALIAVKRKKRYLLHLDLTYWDEVLPKPYLSFCGSQVGVAQTALASAFKRANLRSRRFRTIKRALRRVGLLDCAQVWEEAPDPTLPNTLRIDFDLPCAPGKRLMSSWMGRSRDAAAPTRRRAPRSREETGTPIG